MSDEDEKKKTSTSKDDDDDDDLFGKEESDDDNVVEEKEKSGGKDKDKGGEEDDEDDDFIEKTAAGDDDDEDEDGASEVKHFDGESEEDEDEGGEDDEEEDLLLASKKRKKSSGKKNDKDKKRTKTKRTRALRFFADEAEDAGEDDEDEDDNFEKGEEFLDEDVLAAQQRVAQRHEKNKEMLDQNAEEIAARFQERHKQEQRAKVQMQKQRQEWVKGGYKQQYNPVMQQSLLPTTTDPKIFMFKCKNGMEMQLVRSILLKTVDMRNQNPGSFLKVKSAFCNSSPGIVYVEALNEKFAKEVTMGLRGMYQQGMSQIPTAEMTSVLNVYMKRRPLKPGQWVRIKRGVLKGDLARVLGIYEGGSKAFIQAVPRPDYTNTAEAEAAKKLKGPNTVRPSSRPFDSHELPMDKQDTIYTRMHPLDNTGSLEPFQVYQNDYYRDGFLFKEVTVNSFLLGEDVNPTLEELQLFKPSKKVQKDYDDEDFYDADGRRRKKEEDDDDDDDNLAQKGFLKELAEQMSHITDEEMREMSKVAPFVPGDLVQVTEGEMRNLIAKVISVNDANGVASIIPYNNTATTETLVETRLLTRYIFPGAHIKVVSGKYMGQTGRVVSVMKKDSDYVAAVLTDSINTEIQVNVGHCQLSSEVTTGHGNLAGYELYDLVSLSENETAMVIVVGQERLKVINQINIVKDVQPMQVQSKQNFHSQKATSFDSQQNIIKCGDTVNVSGGSFMKMSGTIKHQFKGNLWLHSNSYLKNSGVFVVKSRVVGVAGAARIASTKITNYGNLHTAASARASGQGGTPMSGITNSPNTSSSQQQQQNRFSKDPALNTTVKIIRGALKGLLANVVDATPTHFNLELLARFKKIVIERSKVEPAGDRSGAFARGGGSGPQADNTHYAVPPTPLLTSQTPLYNGSATPMMRAGSETPMQYGDGSRTPQGGFTPGRNDDSFENPWRVNSNDYSSNNMDSNETSIPTDPSLGIEDGGSGSRPGTQYSNQSNHFSMGTNAYSPAEGLISSSPALSSDNNVSPSLSKSPLIGDRSGSNPRESFSATPAPAQLYREWPVDMVIVLKRGENTGNMGAITKILDIDVANGRFQVCLRDSQGRLNRAKPMELSAVDMKPANPAKKKAIMVFTGPSKGIGGFCKRVVNNEVLVEIPDKKPCMFKLSEVAWLNVDEST